MTARQSQHVRLTPKFPEELYKRVNALCRSDGTKFVEKLEEFVSRHEAGANAPTPPPLQTADQTLVKFTVRSQLYTVTFKLRQGDMQLSTEGQSYYLPAWMLDECDRQCQGSTKIIRLS